jgi:hypothetical protein
MSVHRVATFLDRFSMSSGHSFSMTGSKQPPAKLCGTSRVASFIYYDRFAVESTRCAFHMPPASGQASACKDVQT